MDRARRVLREANDGDVNDHDDMDRAKRELQEADDDDVNDLVCILSELPWIADEKNPGDDSSDIAACTK